LFAQLHSPLIERVHVPDHPLHADLVLVQGDRALSSAFSTAASKQRRLTRTVSNLGDFRKRSYQS
jgi:hypothetical protein